MASTGSSRRILLAFAACGVVAGVFVFVLTRSPAPEREARTTPSLALPVPAHEEAVVPAEAALPAHDVPGIPWTELPLRLLATVVNEEASLSLATIEDVERAARAVMSEGQSLQGRPSVRIAKIERARVLLDHDGVLEQLVIVPAETASADPVELEITPEERERRRDLARRLRELTDAGDAPRPGARGGLLAEGDVSAVYGEDGEMVGVYFDGIRAGGVYDRLGLRNGDVVTEINGVSLGDPTAAAQVLAQLASADELVVSLDRAGSPETLRILTEAFENAVEELE